MLDILFHMSLFRNYVTLQKWQKLWGPLCTERMLSVKKAQENCGEAY